jgi:hypothetical protein
VKAQMLAAAPYENRNKIKKPLETVKDEDDSPQTITPASDIGQLSTLMNLKQPVAICCNN